MLTGLVANKIYPDPYIGMNNMLIPDASDEFNKEYNLEQYSYIPNVGNPWKKPYWYRTTFPVPAGDKGRHFQLIFKGINYRAAVWVNGRQVADSTQMVGMFAEYSLDVSKFIQAGQENGLAVKIYPLDTPGLPAQEQLKAMGPFFENGGPTGDIGKNVTMLCSVGWDWMPPVRDRNMGIWRSVYLRTSGEVTIVQPHIITDLPNLPDTSVAKISLSLTLSNHSNNSANGKLNITIKPENFAGRTIQFSREASVPAGGHKSVELNADNTGQFLLNNPHLWWPNGHGKANLYRLRLQYETDGMVTDDTTFVFGVRTVSTKAENVPGKLLRRKFYVNGKFVQLVGGAWVPDMMVNRDSLRNAYELQLCRNANVNLVRIWGGGVTPSDAFFELADREGLMVWSDFWVTGDTQGEFKGSKDWPLEGNVYLRNVESTIYRIRNHPSLLLWTGGNEGLVRKELYDGMRNSVITLDGTRPFLPSSSGYATLPKDWAGTWPDNLPPGVYSSGPYTWEDAKQYFRLANDAKDWVFKDETGLPSQPPYNTLTKIIPDLVWDTKLPFPLNNSWGYHDAATGNGRYDKYYDSMVKLYGKPTSMIDFSNKMQLMNATAYQGIFEAAGQKLNDIGGVMLWKLNAAFPSVIWQVYDWYMEPNSGYYFMQNACEPLHIQLDALDYKVTVVNRKYKPVQDLTVSADVYDINSKQLFHKTGEVKLKNEDVEEPFRIDNILKNTNGVNFVDLNLKDAGGRIVSHNFYWLASDNNYEALNTMPRTNVEVSVMSRNHGDTEKSWIVSVTNNSDKLAFFIRPQIMDCGEEVLPSDWSANYFSLAPGETISVTVTVPAVQLKSAKPELKISGWNVDEQRIALN